jgi:hypothetical protein
MVTNKQYDNKTGPKIGQLPNFGGKQDSVMWSFDDGVRSSDISDFSEESKNRDNSSADVAFGASLSDNDYAPPVRPASRNKKKNKGKKSKKNKKSKKRNRTKGSRKGNGPNFYNATNTQTMSSMAPDASKMATPKFKKGRGVKKNQSISPRGASSKYTSNSVLNEGGSRISPTHLRNSSSKEFWKYDPSSIGKVDLMKSKKGRASYKSQKRSNAFTYKKNGFSISPKNSISPKSHNSQSSGYRD